MEQAGVVALMVVMQQGLSQSGVAEASWLAHWALVCNKACMFGFIKPDYHWVHKACQIWATYARRTQKLLLLSLERL